MPQTLGALYDDRQKNVCMLTYMSLKKLFKLRYFVLCTSKGLLSFGPSFCVGERGVGVGKREKPFEPYHRRRLPRATYIAVATERGGGGGGENCFFLPPPPPPKL